MDTSKSTLLKARQASSHPLRDAAAVIFRRRKLAATSFFAVFGAAILVIFLQPDVYESEMKILVKRERADPMVTSVASGGMRTEGVVREQDLTSEVELLKSQDLLEQTVTECALDTEKSNWLVATFRAMKLYAGETGGVDDRPYRVSAATTELKDRLRVLPLRNSNLIAASYSAQDPAESACVLKAVERLYLEKHTAVHRIAGAFEFFRHEAERYRTDLSEIERQLAELTHAGGMASPEVEKELMVLRLSEINASLIDKNVGLAQAEARMRMLEAEANSLEERHVTSVRMHENPQLPELRSSLLRLNLQYQEMLNLYQPDYRPVKELENQIRDLQQQIASAESSPVAEETTGRNPVLDWARMEMAHTEMEMASLRAMVPAVSSTVAEYRDKLIELERHEAARQQLSRLARVTEDNYLLYLRKQEEARISDALDNGRFLNVAIAQAATVPLLPRESGLPQKLAFGGLLAALASLGLVFGADFSARRICTPRDVEDWVDAPVLASIPQLNRQAANSRQEIRK